MTLHELKFVCTYYTYFMITGKDDCNRPLYIPTVTYRLLLKIPLVINKNTNYIYNIHTYIHVNIHKPLKNLLNFFLYSNSKNALKKLDIESDIKTTTLVFSYLLYFLSSEMQVFC